MNRSHIKNIKSLQTDCKENQFEEFQDLLHRNFKYFSYIVFSNKLVEYNSIKNESSMVIEDCKALSNIVVDEIELADDFNYEYVLEVSSPGIDRPLTCEEDFNFWVNNKVFVKLKKPINKTKKMTGILKGIFNKNIKLEDVDSKSALEIEVDNIRDINIVWSPEVTNLN